MSTKPIPRPQPIPVSAAPQRGATPGHRETNNRPAVTVLNPCDRGLQLKIEMSDLEFEYDKLKPSIEAWCEANGGTYNSPLGSYATRYTPKWEYPAEIELQRIALKQAEERARLDGSAIVINTTVSVAATIVKNSHPKVREIR
jgi:hypothetical protein